MSLAGVLGCVVFGCHSSITSDPRSEDLGFESVLTLISVASKGGRSLKVVDPSAARHEKIGWLAAHCVTVITITKVPRLRP